MGGHRVEKKLQRAFQRRRAEDYRTQKKRLIKSSGPASPCRRLSADGEVIGTIEAHEPAAAGMVAGPPVLGTPKLRAYANWMAAKRQRERRRRKDSGKLVVTLVLDDELLDALVALGWVREWDRDKPEVVGQSILEGLREAVIER